MYAPRGKQRAEDGIRSEWRSVMGRIALQDLGHFERGLTYTYGLRMQEGQALEEQSRGEYRGTTGLRLWMDEHSFIKTGETRAAKGAVNNRNRQVSGRYLFT
jgi:hypothetical protein